MWDFPLFPESASNLAGRVDAVYFALVLFMAVIIALVCFLVVFFSVRYRKGSRHNRAMKPASALVELVWSIPLFTVALGIFTWAGKVYFDMRTMPDSALQIYVFAKQWMWKFEHADGRREINDLHLPVGEAVRLTMTSEDVIHSLYIPAFRVKMDVLPDTYHEQWFTPTRVGTYHLFCAEYCGTEHSQMRGRVIVMSRGDYQEWLAGRGIAAGNEVLGEMTGADLLDHFRCLTCHEAGGAIQAPSLTGIWGRRVPLSDGTSVIVDEQYVRESILEPQAKVVAGYPPVMPTYRGQISESQISQLIEFIRKSGVNRATAETSPAPVDGNVGGGQSDTGERK